MSEMSTAESDILHGKASNKLLLTLPSFSPRIIAQSDSLTKYEASTQHRINASAANSGCRTTGKDASFVVDMNNNCRQSQCSLEESADVCVALENMLSVGQPLNKKKSYPKKKKKKKPHSRGGKELSCEDPAGTSLTCQASPLENGDGEDITKSSDHMSDIESEIDSSPSPKSSCSDVPLSTASEHSESMEYNNLQPSKEDDQDVQQPQLSKVSLCNESLGPADEKQLQSECSQMQQIETGQIHSMAETGGNEAIVSGRGSSAQKGLLPSDAIPTVAGLEKSRKDLQRQMALLHRLTPVLKEQMEKSLNSLTVTFQEIHDRLNHREIELVSELNRVTSQASTILSEQKKKGEQLKHGIQQLVQPTDSDIAQMKSEIKQYVSKRKVYEEMSECHRFVFDWTKVLEEISKFGEIVPLEAADDEFPAILIPTQSSTSPPPPNQLETATAAITLTITIDESIEKPSLNHGIQVWPPEDGQSPSETLVDNGEHMRQDVVDLRITEGQVPSLTGGVTVQMEQDHRQRTNNNEVFVDSVVVNEDTASNKSPRLNSWEEDEIQTHSADNPQGKPSPNAHHQSSNGHCSSDADANGLSSNKHRNLEDPNSTDVHLHMYSSKGKNSPKDLVNPILPSNSSSSNQAKASERQIICLNSSKQLPSDSKSTHKFHPSDQPLEQSSGDEKFRLKSGNTAQGKHHLQQIQRMHSSPVATSDYHHPLRKSLLSKTRMSTGHTGSSLVKPLHVLDEDNTEKTEDAAVLFSSTEPGENKEQKENVGNSNKKKKKKKKSKKSKDLFHMDNTVQDDDSPSVVSDYSKNGEVIIQHKIVVQRSNSKEQENVQDQPNPAQADTEQLTNKKSFCKKHKKYPVKKNDDDDKSLRCDNTVRIHNDSTEVKNETILSAMLDKPREATRSSEVCLQNQNHAIKTGKTDDRNAAKKCRDNEQNGQNVAQKNAVQKSSETYSRYEIAGDKCKRENIAPNLNMSLQKNDKPTLNHSVKANRSMDELQNMQVKVNNRPAQNQNYCPVQREEAVSEKRILSLKDQQRSEINGLRTESSGVLKPKNYVLKVTDNFQKSKEAKQVRTTPHRGAPERITTAGGKSTPNTPPIISH